MAETALVLGGSGFLGAHLVRACVAAWPGLSIVSAGRNAQRGSIEGSLWQSWDALDATHTECLFETYQPKLVILAAALARASACESQPQLATQLNAVLPGRVARLARKHAARMLHLSTDLVFGAKPPRGERFCEQDAPAPLDHYGRTKVAGESAALAAGALVVRVPLLFGDSGGSAMGAGDALFDALQAGQNPGLFSDEWRTPLEVSSAARALLELASLETSGVLHLAGAERLSRYELGCRLLRAAGKAELLSRLRSLTRAEAGMAHRAADVALDGSRANALLRVLPEGAPPARRLGCP